MDNYNFYVGYIERKRKSDMDKEKGMGAVLALAGLVALYVGLKMMFGV